MQTRSEAYSPPKNPKTQQEYKWSRFAKSILYLVLMLASCDRVKDGL